MNLPLRSRAFIKVCCLRVDTLLLFEVSSSIISICTDGNEGGEESRLPRGGSEVIQEPLNSMVNNSVAGSNPAVPISHHHKPKKTSFSAWTFGPARGFLSLPGYAPGRYPASYPGKKYPGPVPGMVFGGLAVS